MTSNDGSVEIGRQIAKYRQRRGLSQTEFGRLIDRSEAWVSQVERGVRPVKNLEILERIAQVANIPLVELAPTAPAAVVTGRPAVAIPLRHLLGANYALRSIVDRAPDSTKMAELHRGADRAWELTHASQYNQLIPLLETLLPKMEHARRGTHGRGVPPLLARTYYACAAALAKLGQFDAAWVAADRAIGEADRAGDPLLMAEGAFRLALVFQGARQFDQAKHTATTASEALANLVTDGRAEALSVYGALQLQLAVIAAREQCADVALRHLDAARKVANQLGHDRNDYNTEFGPANVAVHEVAVAVELGDAGAAIRRADDIDTSKLSNERQGRLLIDVARAWAQRRNVDRALAALCQAEQITPEQVHNHIRVAAIIRDLLQMSASPTQALQEFADRMNVVA